jgi:hypothetical protein
VGVGVFGSSTLGAELSWEEGLSLLEDQDHPTVDMYNAVIGACAKVRRGRRGDDHYSHAQDDERNEGVFS